jgi:hypothetical protein
MKGSAASRALDCTSSTAKQAGFWAADAGVAAPTLMDAILAARDRIPTTVSGWRAEPPDRLLRILIILWIATCLIERLDRGRVQLVLLVMLRSSDKILIASPLVETKSADTLHVAQH